MKYYSLFDIRASGYPETALYNLLKPGCRQARKDSTDLTGENFTLDNYIFDAMNKEKSRFYIYRSWTAGSLQISPFFR